MWWREAYKKIFTSEAMKAATATGVMAATINIIGAHYGAYRVRKSKIAEKYNHLHDEHQALKDEYARYKQDKSDEIRELQDSIKEFQVRTISLENHGQAQKEALTALHWKADARKEAIERLPFFMRPTVRRLPKENVTSSSLESKTM